MDRSKKGQNYSPPSHKYVEEKEEKVAGFLDSDEEEEGSSTFLNKWVGKLKNIVGDKKITREDLSEVMAEFKQKLMEKNVAQ